MNHHPGRAVLVLALFLIALAPHAAAGGIAIVATTLSDNGDDDGFADTDETVTLHVTVQNTSGVALEDVALTLYTSAPAIACLSVPTVQVGDLAAGETRAIPEGFVFTVGSVDRATLGLGPFDPLLVEFEVFVTSTPADQRAFPGRLSYDLDLDLAGGSGSASFFESFENGADPLGAFEVQNLDAGLETLEAADGYRCQYNDPDYVNSNTYGSGPVAERCHPGANPAHAAAVWWGISGPETSPAGGRGFSGFHSLFFGLDLGPPDNWTTPVGIIEAAAMSDPVNIGDGGATLIFKHQTSLADARAFNLSPRESYDRGVVMVQVADETDAPIGPWFRVEPYQNGYDQQNAPNILNCTYDPIDDGTTEDDYFAPSNPDRRYGPSASCYPQYVFVRQGETSNPFAADNLGYAEGPGLQGLWGIGTWVESRVDLSRFRGRRVRVRFLAATVNAGDFETWEDIFQLNPNSGDDGWWIDDVQIDGLVATPASVVVDVKDNSGLPDVLGDLDADLIPDACDNCAAVANGPQEDDDQDGLGDLCDPCPGDQANVDPDGDLVCGGLDNCPMTANPSQIDADADGFGRECDCDDLSAATFPGASEVNDGRDNNCPGDPGFGLVDEISGLAGFDDPGGSTTLFSWPPQAGAIRYEVARAADPSFSVGCVLSIATSSTIAVTFVPGPGEVAYLLVRPQTPFNSSWGADSSGTPRNVTCAP